MQGVQFVPVLRWKIGCSLKIAAESMQRPEIGRSPVRSGPAGYSGGPVGAGIRSCVDRKL